MNRDRRNPQRITCKLYLLLCVFLGSLPCLAQAVSVSVKLRISDAASEHKHAAKPTTGASSGAAVVWLTPLDGSVPPRSSASPASRYSLVQKNKQFIPHLLVVRTGTSIDFPNEDPFFHNVFSLFNGKRFDLGLYEAGSRRSVRFDREGVSYIFCNIHPQMGAVVVSVSTPYYAMSSSDGSVTIANVQPGEYTLNVWAEGVAAGDLIAASRKVTISESNAALGTISLNRTTSSQAHTNKFGEDYKPTNETPY